MTNFDGRQSWPQDVATSSDARIINGMRDILYRTYPIIEQRFKDFLALLGGTITGTLSFGAAGVLVVPVYAADPVSPANGTIWYNSTTGTFKCMQNGVTKTFTTA